jgi:hypothetical protein
MLFSKLPVFDICPSNSSVTHFLQAILLASILSTCVLFLFSSLPFSALPMPVLIFQPTSP